MSSSDSPLSEAAQSVPPDAEIARALREVVRQAANHNELEELTLKRVRLVVTNQLDLPEDFLKTDAKWKGESKAIVTQEVEKLEDEPSATASTPIKAAAKSNKAKSPVQKKGPGNKNGAAHAKPQKRKPAHTTKAPQAKRWKKTASDSDDDISELPSDESGDPGDENSSSVRPSQAPAKPTTPKKNTEKPKPAQDDELGPESDLSDVIDDAPAVSKGKRKKDKDSGSSSKNPAKAKATAKAKPKPEMTPQEEEIKRLQSQLGKCGIRKVWGVTLSKFDTPRDKIAHLKSMLRDVGMEGRFSEDKARQIREERELRADLEAIQEGDEMWGMKEDVPRKRLARGLQELQGLGDDEESD